MQENIKQLIELFDCDDEPMLKMDGYDECIAGIVERFGQPPIVCYDKDLVLDELMKQGMPYDDAVEWWEFNQIGAWVGETTPCFLTRPQPTHERRRFS